MATSHKFLQLAGFDTQTSEAFEQAQYQALIRQLPILYLGLTGVTVAISAVFAQSAPAYLTLLVPLFFVLIGINRIHYWHYVAPIRLQQKDIASEFPRHYRVALLLGVIYSGWSVVLRGYGDSQQVALLCFLLFVWMVNAVLSMSTVPVVALFIIPLMTTTITLLMLSLGESIYTLATAVFVLSSFMILTVIRQSYNNLVAVEASKKELEMRRLQAEAAEQQAQKVASQDPLTGLANRRWFQRTVAKLITERDESGEGFSLFLIDLDGFKPVNDVYGHKAGDLVLQEVALRLTGELGELGFLARLGGDEFGAVVRVSLDEREAEDYANRLCDQLRQPFALDGSRTAHLSGTCGIASFPVAGKTTEQLLMNADVALYEAKDKARGRAMIFSGHLDSVLRRRSHIEQALRAAIVVEDFFLHFQPIVDIEDFSISSLEALARWNDLELGPISPAEFIPLAEQIGLIDQISDILLRKAAAEAVKWPDRTLLSFNLSALQLVKPDTGLRILSILEQTGLSPNRLEIEVTETALMTDFEAALATINVLRAAGIRTSLDDFGVGYASFTYLHKIAFDRVKIDSSFTAGILHDAKARQIVKAVIDLCNGLGMECVAEGIESREQLEALQQLDCGLGQGYYLVRPTPANGVVPLLRGGWAASRSPVPVANAQALLVREALAS